MTTTQSRPLQLRKRNESRYYLIGKWAKFRNYSFEHFFTAKSLGSAVLKVEIYLLNLEEKINSNTSEELSFENLKFNPFSTNVVLLNQNLDLDVNFYISTQNLATHYFPINELS